MRRATSTAPPTTRGWPSRPAPARSPRASSRLVGRRRSRRAAVVRDRRGPRAHVEEIDEAVARWIGERDRDTVLAAFEAAEAAIAPIYDASDVLADPQLAAIGSIANVDGIVMPNVIAGSRRHRARSATPAESRATTRKLCSTSSGSARRSSGGCVRRGSSDRPAAHLAVCPRRPPRPGREGDRLGGARGDRRPRGRRRAGGQGRGPGRPGGAALDAAPQAGLRPGQRRGRRRPGGGRRCSR